MKDSTMKNLAITEKKVQQHKPGDYVGIFFQLIDWKRKLYKKKLFSKKLFPPDIKLCISSRLERSHVDLELRQ
ncbi:hypothetical protein D0Y65_049031 [Glycine soja]|uniref:Uncharacterized protein n=1 Tax=Glycine soja TaxID=3848 RepID=A0A445FV49_GLYSO|nr:hypothetical protein D0Y65_049031 [Glycine soja]